MTHAHTTLILLSYFILLSVSIITPLMKSHLVLKVMGKYEGQFLCLDIEVLDPSPQPICHGSAHKFACLYNCYHLLKYKHKSAGHS